MTLTNQTYYNHILVTAPKIDTDSLWLLTLVFLGLAILYFVSVFFFRNKISSQSSKTGKRKKELSPMISEFLFYEDDVDKEEKSRYIDLKIQIRELLKDEFNRKVLTEILLDLRKDVSGDTQKRLFKLYQDLGLEKDAFEKLTSWRWEVVSKGISHLTQMQVKSAYSFITKFINHRRGTIRKQAEIATVSLKPEGINYFLDTTRYKISEWQQLKLLDVIRNQEDFDPPRFKMWLTSTNKHVVLFALRLIKYYNQNDANSSLIELLKHKNNQIKTEAISCIKEFHVIEALPTLKMAFHKGNVDVKIAMLGTIGSLGSTSDIEFLHEVSQREGNFSVKSKALAAINMIAPETIMPTKGIEVITKEKYGSTDSEEKEEITHDTEIDIKAPAVFMDEDESTDPENAGPITDKTDLVDDTVPKTIEKQEKVVDTVDEMEEELNEVVKTYMENEIGLETYSEENTETEEEDIISPTAEKREEVDTVEDLEEEQNKVAQIQEDNEVTLEANVKEDLENEEIEIKNSMPEQSDHISTHKEAASIENKEAFDEDDIELNETPIDSSNAIEPTTFDTTPEDSSSKIANENILHFDFIPLVVANKPNPDQILEKYRPMADFNEPNQDPKTMEVEFEEVSIFEEDTETNETTADFNVSEINFLPLVIDNDQNQTSVANETDENIAETSISDIEVSYVEIASEPMDEELHELISEINELDFLPIVTDEKTIPVDEQEVTTEAEEPHSMDHLEGYTLSDFEVEFEETQNVEKDETVPFNLEDSPIIDVENPSVDDVMSWLMAHNELREMEIQYDIVDADQNGDKISDLIPEPIYYDEHEAYMMGLLDDLEELGDHREIPFLEELLAVEKKSFIKDRINQLITRFASQKDNRTVRKNDGQEHDVLPAFSVFADLFKNIDTECKLILLDEVVAVGDEREVPFLDSLLEDPHPGIRKKAQNALKLLVAKISDAKGNVGDKKKQKVEELPTRIFECDLSFEKKVNERPSVNEEAADDHMEVNAQTDPEIFAIDFELAEVLDHGHSKNILNLPVVATEISPNGASLIFKLRDFPNNIMRKFNG